MNDLLNPYIAGAPVVEASMFFGREDVFTWIENSLTGKFVGHILVLHGQRRVGKTSVLKQIPNFLPPEYIQVFFDLQGRTNTTLDRFLWWMASEIVRTLNKHLESELPRPSRDQFADPEAFITEFIPSLQPILGKHSLLVTFDEFDTLDRPDIQGSLARPLISFLRRLFEIDGLNFVFSIGSSGNKLENMQAAYTDFFKTALYRKVSFLTKDECHGLITKPVKGVITYQPDAIQRITEITSGHPYFTQLTCHELFSRCQKTGERIINVEDVEAILNDVIERGTVNLKFVWDEASNLEKWILAALGKTEGLSQKDLSATLKSQGVRFVDSDLNSALLHLRDKDVLTQDNRLVIHLMKLWLELNRPMDRVREELVETNPIADRYIEIGDEYRDREQWEQALNSYQQAISVQANNLTALVNIGAIHLEQEKYQQAAVSFEKALQVDNEHIAARQGYCQAQLALGDQARKKGATSDAIEAYQAILNLTPVHSEARQNLAGIYREQAETYLSSGDDQQAIERLHLAIEMMPEDEELKNRHQAIIDEKKAALVKSWLDKADRAVKRKRWDEASQMAEEALKVDPRDRDLQRRVAEIKDAPRQEKLKAYKLEAETAITKGDYQKAIAALGTAVLLAPEDTSLADWLENTRSDSQHAQLRMYQNQAQQAETAGNWEAAIVARESALKLDPQNKDLRGALIETQAAQRQARLKELRGKAAQARQEKKWDEAITATQALLELEPDDQEAHAELEILKAAGRQAKLEGLLTQGEEATRLENWKAAISAWESYLKEVPEDAEKLADRLTHARKYAQLSSDYEEAQEFLRKKQYNRAVSKLQGIITIDPTYKSTSRLLVEAVEARGKQKPIKISPKVWIALGGIAIIAAFFVFLPRIKGLFLSQRGETPDENNPAQMQNLAQENPIDQLTIPSSANLENQPEEGLNFFNPILAYVDSQDPDFQEDFSSEQDYWQEQINFEGGSTLSISEGKMLINGGKTEYSHNLLSSNDFVLQYDFSPNNFNHDSFTSICLYGYGSNFENYYGFALYFDGMWDTFYPSPQSNLEQGRVTDWRQQLEDHNGSATIKVIVQDNKLAIYINELPIVFQEDVGFSGFEISHQIVFYSPSNTDAVATFDNVAFWNLDGVALASLVEESSEGAPAANEEIVSDDQLTQIQQEEFTSSIMTYLNDTPPTFSDDFSTPNDDWGGSLQTYMMDGLLKIPASAGQLSFPENNLFDAQEFVISFEFSPQIAFVGFRLNFHQYRFSASGNPGDYYIYENDSLLKSEGRGWLSQNDFYEIIIVIKDSTLAVFWGPYLIFYEENVQLTGDSADISFDILNVWEGDTIYLDNVHFWNLDGVDLEASSDEAVDDSTPDEAAIEDAKPDWVTNFVEPILEYISDRSPDVEDQFTTESDAWEMLRKNINYDTPTIRNNEVILKEVVLKNKDVTFYDYVVEVDVRIITDGAIGLELSNGADVRITYEITEDGVWSVNIFEQRTHKGRIPKSGKYHLQVIIKGSQFAFLINSEPILYYEYEPYRLYRGDVPITALRVHSGNAAFSNFKVWNLSDFELDLATEPENETSEYGTNGEIPVENSDSIGTPDLYEPILKYLSEGHTKYKDDMSSPEPLQGVDNIWDCAGGGGWSAVQDGYRSLSSWAGTQVLCPPYLLFSATDFAMQFDITFDDIEPLEEFGLYLRSEFNLDGFYKFVVTSSDSGWAIIKSEGSETIELGKDSLVFDPYQYNTFLIIAKQEYLAVFINGQLEFEMNDLAYLGINNQFFAYSEERGNVRLTNFNFWVLNSVDFW